MKRKKIYGAMAISMVLIFLFTGGVWAQTTKTLTVGYAGAMSGGGAAWGAAFDRAQRIACEDINAKGGIKVGGDQYLIELKTFDHAYDPSKAVEIVQRMIKVDKVAWVSSHGTTAVKPMIPFTEEAKLIHVTGIAGTDIRVFQKQKYAFQVLTSGPEAHFLTWQWIAKKHPEWKTTVGLQPDDASGWDIMKDVREWVLPRAGVKLLDHTFYRRGITDFYPVLIKLLGTKPDVFDLQNMPPADQGRVLKQVREMGFKGPIIAPIGGSIGPILEIAGQHAEGLILGASIDPTTSYATPEEKGFYAKWQQKYAGQIYDFYSIQGYYWVAMVAEAVQMANSFDGDKVSNILRTQEVTVLGRKAKFVGAKQYGDTMRQVNTPYFIYVVENGKPRVIDKVELPADY